MPTEQEIAAGASIFQQVGNAIQMLRKEQMDKMAVSDKQQWDKAQTKLAYDRQRKDALDDFARTNAYNSPQQQMERLRQAGLNPHLVYGKGADNIAQMVSKTNMNVPTSDRRQVFGFDVPNPNTLVQDAQLKAAQTDNLYETNALLKKEQVLKDATTAKTLGEAGLNKFQLDMNNRLKDNTVRAALLDTDAKSIGLYKGEADINYTNQQLKLSLQQEIQNQLNQSKTKEETQLLQIAQKNANIDGALKQAELNLAEEGIQKTDPAYMRLIIQQLKKIIKF